MAQAPVASQVHQTFDIHGDFGPELTFDFTIIIYHFADTVDLHFRQIIGIRIRIDFELRKNLIGCASAYTVYVG